MIDPTPAVHHWTVTPAVSASEATLTDDGTLFPALGAGVYTGYPTGQGATYFADADATSAGTGTFGDPFQDWQDGIDALHPGDRLFLKGSQSSYGEVVIDTSWGNGNASQLCQVLGLPGSRVEAPSSYTGTMIKVLNSGWVFQGLEVDVANGNSNRVFEVSEGGSTQLVLDVVIDSCQLTDHGFKNWIPSDDAIALNIGSRNVRISNNTISGFWQGVHDSGVDCHGIVVRRGSKNVEVIGNHIFDNSGDGIQLAAANPLQAGFVPTNIQIEGNHIHHNRENAADLKSCSNVTVSENLMYGAQGAIPDYGPGCVVKVHAEARGVTLERNYMHTAARGIDVGVGNGTGEGPRDLVIHQNVLEGNGYPGMSGLQLEFGINYQMEPSVASGDKVLQITQNIFTGWAVGIQVRADAVEMDTVTIANNAIFEPTVNQGLRIGMNFPLDLAGVPNLNIDGMAFAGSDRHVSIIEQFQIASQANYPDSQFGIGPVSLIGGELSNWILPVPMALKDEGINWPGNTVTDPDIGVSEL